MKHILPSQEIEKRVKDLNGTWIDRYIPAIIEQLDLLHKRIEELEEINQKDLWTESG